MLDLKWFLLPILLLVVLVWGLYWHEERSKLDPTEVPGLQYFREQALWDWEQVEEAMRGCERDFSAAALALETHRFEFAHAAFQKADAFRQAFAAYGQREVAPSLSLEQWFTQNRQKFYDALLVSLDGLLDGLEAGTVTNTQLYNLLKQYGYEPANERYQLRIREIVRSRLPNAGHWLRVVFKPTASPYRPIVEDALKAAWNPAYGKTLQFADPLDARETAAAWMTLTVNIEEIPESGPELSVLPAYVKLSASLLNRRDIPTTWNRSAEANLIPSFEAHLDKQHLGIELHSGSLAARREKLTIALAQQLKKFPRFELYPGESVQRLKLDPNKPDLSTLKKLGVLDPKRFASELPDYLEKVQIDEPLELARLFLDQDYHAGADWLIAQIHGSARQNHEYKIWEERKKTLEREHEAALSLARKDKRNPPSAPAIPPQPSAGLNLYQLMGVLKQKPWFGAYEPYLALLKQTTGGFRIDAAQGLNEYYHEPIVRDITLQLVKTRDDSSWQKIGLMAIDHFPSTELSVFFDWIRDPDGSFARDVFMRIARRSELLANTLTLEHFATVSPSMQLEMMNYFKFDPQTQGERSLTLLQSAVLQRENERLRTIALSRLLQPQHVTPQSWRLLAELLPDEQNRQTRESIQHVLVETAERALPLAEAREFLLKQLQAEDPQLTRLATSRLLALPGDNTPYWIAVVKFYNRLPAGHANKLQRQQLEEMKDRLLLAAAQGLNRAIDAGRLEQPQSRALQELFDCILVSNDPLCRAYAYDSMRKLSKQGITLYEERLRSALARERNIHVRETFRIVQATTQ